MPIVQNLKRNYSTNQGELRRKRSKAAMKGREIKGAPSADLLVCFPSRAHLTLMPRPICSPERPSEPNKRHHNHQHQHQHRLLKISSTRNGGGAGGQASPLLWAKNKQMGSEIMEPSHQPPQKSRVQGRSKSGLKQAHVKAGNQSWKRLKESTTAGNIKKKAKLGGVTWF